MPTSLFGAFLFVVLLFPGYVYERRRERDIPDRTRSPFREVLAIVFMGAIADLAALMILILATALRPSARLDVARLINVPAQYLSGHYEAVSGWTVATLVMASGFAYVVASRPWYGPLARWSPRYAGWVETADPQQSAWWLLMYRTHPGARKYVACYLDDGSYVAGLLHGLSRASNETVDRDISLRNDPEIPLILRQKGGDKPAPLEKVGVVVISARRITMLTVSYLPKTADGSDPGLPARSAASTGSNS